MSGRCGETATGSSFLPSPRFSFSRTVSAQATLTSSSIYVTASLRLDPRPIYLIFENAGRECGRDQMSLFERAPMPLLNQAKAFLFAPVSIAVYRSKVEIANWQDAERCDRLRMRWSDFNGLNLMVSLSNHGPHRF